MNWGDAARRGVLQHGVSRRFLSQRFLPHRVVLLALAGAILLSGLDAALLRLGVPAPVSRTGLADAHGPLMVYGFLTTVICLERAVALHAVARRSAWAYAAPAVSALGGVLLVADAIGAPVAGRAAAGGAWCAALTVLLAVYAVMWRAQPGAALLVQMLGAFAGLAGAALWSRGIGVPQVFPWWMGLLVLTIAGERLDLARLAFRGRLARRILVWAATLLAALPAALLAPQAGYALLGVTLGALTADLALHDIARNTLRQSGMARLSAACILGGYAWAFAAAMSWILAGPAFGGYRYDFTVHAITVGFVVSMVLAHAPMIVPAIVHRRLPYHPLLWAVWAVLQAGLLLRVLAGFRASVAGWRLGGVFDVVALLALLGYIGTRVSASVRRHEGGRR